VSAFRGLARWYLRKRTRRGGSKSLAAGFLKIAFLKLLILVLLGRGSPGNCCLVSDVYHTANLNLVHQC
jgi:hypothetical protein